MERGIDLLEWRQDTVASIKDAVTDVTLLEVGVALLIVGLYLWLASVFMKWWKNRGYRMAVRQAAKERSVKRQDILTEIITDGILDRQVKQHLSDQEARQMMIECGEKLNLPDLLNPKQKATAVKEGIKRRLHTGMYKNVAPIPGGPPTPVVATKFSQRLGKLAGKFWRVKSA